MKIKLILVVLLILLFNIYIYSQNELITQFNKEQTEHILNSTYEVVLKKPFDNPYTIKIKEEENRLDEIRTDPIVYEEDLPWDILPYSAKIDEYYSIGTAFAISENTFLSAAHVLNLDKELLWDEIYLRDKNGNVYEINQIIKYSNFKDFVLFTVNKNENINFLKTNINYNLNTKVFAVGNAFGEGIVIRDGLLTSTTKETESGKWDWLRFSAAASPGNSGGPLLNENGEVIGIVLKKSQDENLNFALPISEVLNSKENTAFHHKFMNYQLITVRKKYGPEKYDKEIKLPLYYKDFRKENIKINKYYSEYLLNKLIEKYKENIFPEGKGSFKLLHATSSIYFPHLAIENQDDGIWELYRPKEIQNSQIENNGYLKYGGLSNLGFFELRRPDDVSLKELYENSNLFMDIFLEGYPINRNFGNQQIRIKSLGDSHGKEIFIDKYNRKWQIEKWTLEFANSKLLCMSLPTPLGKVGLFYLADVDTIENALILDIKEYANYFYYSFNGTFKQWKEFLELNDYIPEIFNKYKLIYNNNHFNFITDRINIKYSPDIFKITDDSYLVLKTTYYKENNKIIWDITGTSIWENKNDKNYFSIIRDNKPEKELPESYHALWDDLIYRKYPYNGIPKNENGNTNIGDLHNSFKSISTNIRKNLNTLYSIDLNLEGEVEKDEIKDIFEKLNDSIIINDLPIMNNTSEQKKGKLRH